MEQKIIGAKKNLSFHINTTIKTDIKHVTEKKTK